MIKISGMPIIKTVCLVLWRNVCIPAIEPADPPMAAMRKRVFSGIRHLWCLALYLSMPILAKPARFMIIRYITKYFIVYAPFVTCMIQAFAKLFNYICVQIYRLQRSHVFTIFGWQRYISVCIIFSR